MEALVFLANSVAMVILVITSLRNDRRSPKTPMTGIYRFRETIAPRLRRGRSAATAGTPAETAARPGGKN